MIDKCISCYTVQLLYVKMFNVVPLQQKSILERKLLFAGFLDVQAVETKTFLPLGGAQSLTVSNDFEKPMGSTSMLSDQFLASSRLRVRRLLGP